MVMKIDFDTKITGLRGETLKDGEQDFTLASAACTALLSVFDDERDLDAKTKISRYKLAMKIVEANGAGVDLSVEEVSDVKKLIGKAFAPLIVGRAFEILDP